MISAVVRNFAAQGLGFLISFADRFLARVFVEPVQDSGLEELLAAGWSLRSAPA